MIHSPAILSDVGSTDKDKHRILILVKYKIHISAVVKSQVEWGESVEFAINNTNLLKIIYCTPLRYTYTVYRSSLSLFTDTLMSNIPVVMFGDCN